VNTNPHIAEKNVLRRIVRKGVYTPCDSVCDSVYSTSTTNRSTTARTISGERIFPPRDISIATNRSASRGCTTIRGDTAHECTIVGEDVRSPIDVGVTVNRSTTGKSWVISTST
jgi:hypothetical protein